MDEIMNKVDETIYVIDNSDAVKELKELKSIIDDNQDIQQLINNFNNEKIKYQNTNVITNELLESKKNLYNHPIMKKYRKVYGELYLNIQKFNINISKLLKNKKSMCSNI